MEFDKPVSNPLLVGSMELLKAEETQEHYNLFVAQLQTAKFLAPALIDPSPEEDEEGSLKLLPGSKVQFPMLSASDGNKYFMGFTDDAEYQLWVEKNRLCPTFALQLDDYIGMMMRKDAEGNPCLAQGLVINPYGSNLVLHKDMLARMMADRMIYTLTQGGKKPAQRPHAPNSPANPETRTGTTAGGGDLEEK